MQGVTRCGAIRNISSNNEEKEERAIRMEIAIEFAFKILQINVGWNE